MCEAIIALIGVLVGGVLSFIGQHFTAMKLSEKERKKEILSNTISLTIETFNKAHRYILLCRMTYTHSLDVKKENYNNDIYFKKTSDAETLYNEFIFNLSCLISEAKMIEYNLIRNAAMEGQISLADLSQKIIKLFDFNVSEYIDIK